MLAGMDDPGWVELTARAGVPTVCIPFLKVLRGGSVRASLPSVCDYRRDRNDQLALQIGGQTCHLLLGLSRGGLVELRGDGHRRDRDGDIGICAWGSGCSTSVGPVWMRHSVDDRGGVTRQPAQVDDLLPDLVQRRIVHLHADLDFLHGVEQRLQFGGLLFDPI
ncbi:hypothetical protein D9M71_558680 [compost metagenome]